MYSIALQQALVLLAQKHLSMFHLCLVHLISEKARTRSLASNILSEHIHHL